MAVVEKIETEIAALDMHISMLQQQIRAFKYMRKTQAILIKDRLDNDARIARLHSDLNRHAQITLKPLKRTLGEALLLRKEFKKRRNEYIELNYKN